VYRLYISLLTTLCVAAADQPREVVLHVGPANIKPIAFLDAIEMTRSQTTADSVSTRFGAIPLTETPGESLYSFRHSRLMLKGDVPISAIKVTVYLESDFMNPNAGQSPYRWRQYWAQGKIGRWEVLGGQAWSLLRPNRLGVASDTGLMNTDVIDPAYHVGLMGLRRRQLRVGRAMGNYNAEIAWEANRDLTGRFARDKNGRHFEFAALAGRSGRYGVSAAAAVTAGSRVRVVMQQYGGRKSLEEALAVVPEGVSGLSTIEGLEVQMRKSTELYSYGGLVYGSRSTGNRVVRQWSAGVNHRINAPAVFGTMLFSLQYSHLERLVWSGGSGDMDFLMCRFRYTFN
jgi:hypothetical protein